MTNETLKTELYTPVQSSLGGGELDIISDKELESLITENGPKYTDSEVLGQGGVGAVYETKDSTLKRTVALKVLSSRLKNSRTHVTQFLKEAQLTACIGHPNIIPIHELGYDCDLGIYYTMKKIDGEDFHQILTNICAKNKAYLQKYSRRRLLEIFIQVCNGIAFAHSKGLVHRDIKPENIIVGDYGEVFVIDWGLVKNVDDESVTAPIVKNINATMDTQTLDGQISGTPMYIAPEQIKGDFGYYSDIYSLGATLYTILTLKLPFTPQSDVMKTLNKVFNGEFTRPRKKAPKQKIPKELEAICLKAMALNKNDRYTSVKGLIQDITNYWDHGTISAYCYPPHVKLLKLMKRHPIVSTTIIASLIGGVTSLSGIRAVQYNKAMSYYEIALHNKELADSYLNEALKLHEKTTALAAENNYCRFLSDEEKTLQHKLQQEASTADSRYQIALNNFNKIGPRFKTLEVNQKVKEIFKSKAQFSLTTNQYGRLKKWHTMVKSWLKMSKVNLTEQEKTKLSTIQKTMSGVGKISFTLPKDQEGILTIEKINIYRIPATTRRFMQPQKLDRKRTFELDRGSYLATVRMQGHRPFSKPFYVNYNDEKTINLYIPPMPPKGIAYIHGEKAIIGGRHSQTYREHQQEIAPFFIKKHEVTIKEYLRFWRNLPFSQREQYSPFIPDKNDRCKKVDMWDDNFIILPPYEDMHPITGITLDAAKKFCEWKTTRTGLVHRLPTAVEWEKAARGIDGRQFVWGNRYSKEQANILESGQERKQTPAVIGSFPYDRSIYGVIDLMGNVKEMTASTFHFEDDYYQIKGASYKAYPRHALAAASGEYIGPAEDVGFRYVVEIPPGGKMQRKKNKPFRRENNYKKRLKKKLQDARQ